MPRKPKAQRTEEEDWMARLRESSHDVFLAGLASLARARGIAGTGGRPSWTDFDALVAAGRKLEPELRDSVQKTWDEWRELSRSTMGVMPFRTEGRLQGVFQDRVEAALGSLGVPTRAEFDALNAKLDRLLRLQPGAGRSQAPQPEGDDRAAASTPRKPAARAPGPARSASRKSTPRKPSAR